MIHEQAREPILFLSPHRTSHFHKSSWFAYDCELLWAAAKGPGVEVVHLWWKTLNVKWLFFSFLFFPFRHHIHPFHSKPWPRFALPPAHSPPALLTHLMLLYLYQTQLSNLTSLHPSICPSSFPRTFSRCPHCLSLFPPNNSPSSSISLSFSSPLDPSIYPSFPSIPFFFLIHIHVISIWQLGAAVRDCYFVLKVLKARLIYSNNLGYIQKYHYRSMRAHTHRHTHRAIPTSYSYLLSSILLAISDVLLSCWAAVTIRHITQEKKTNMTFNGIPRECVWPVCLCGSVYFFSCVSISFAIACLKLWGKWEIWVLKSHQFTQQRGRIDWICSELQ